MSKRTQQIFLILMFASGCCGLVYEVVFVKLLTYVFGVTAYAVSTVLAAFMGGLALGSLIFGRWADRTRSPLRLYAALELGIGLYCVWTPALYGLLGDAYTVLYQRFGLSPAAVTVVRYALCWGFILVPTILMGGTLPAAARAFTRTEAEIGPSVSRLYAINTLGAAAGTLGATYLLIPARGLDGALYFAVGLNALVAIVAWVLSRQLPVPVTEVATSDATVPLPRLRLPAVVMLAAFGAGAISLGYEVLWTHVLAQTIGNSVYAFGIMLFTFLLGIGAGSMVLARCNPTAERARRWVAASQWLVALLVLATLPLWDDVPRVFQLGRQGGTWRALLVFVPAALLLAARPLLPRTGQTKASAKTQWPRWVLRAVLLICIVGVWTMRTRLEPLLNSEHAGFWTAESVRFLCSVNLMIWPTLFLGATFPLLIRVYSSRVEELGARIGSLYFVNTAGAIVGSIAAGFWLLPWLGSQTTLRALAVGNWGIGVALMLGLRGWPRRGFGVFAAATAGIGLLLVMVPRWDLRVMNSGANVYFDAGRPIDEILYYAEDAQGGVTSVVREGETTTLLTNGKFEGNDGSEMAAQDHLAHIPMLYTRRFDRVLVIGLGTGRTLAVLAAYPFAHIEVAELAPHIVEAARRHFGHINHDVLRDPRVQLHVTDGRNWLQLTTNTYDAITIEISSIWFAGAANLYNREFYEACSRRLRDGGVLQQWVQLHHMRRHDLLVIFNTMKQVFAHVQLFVSTHQGVLVASHEPLTTDYALIEMRNRSRTIQPSLQNVELGNLFTLFGGLVLDDEAMNQALTYLIDEPRVSTDLRPYLEHATPRGNFLSYDTWQTNETWLARHPFDPLRSVHNIPGPADEHRLRGLAAFGRGDVETAHAELSEAQRLQPTDEQAQLLEQIVRESDLR